MNLLKLIVMFFLFSLLTACATNTPTEAPIPAPWNDAALFALANNTLTPFSGKEEFELYRKNLQRIGKERGYWWASNQVDPALNLLAQTDAEMDCAPGDPACEGDLEEVLVTGSSVSSGSASNTSVTNNQEAQVDEGDIIKLFKNFLVVLQDGRLFTVDLGQTGNQLRLVDRVNIYETEDTYAWYDELLIHDDTVMVTSYQYSDEGRTNIDLFKISDSGVLTRSVTYSIDSYDYYSNTNYATRLVKGKLVLYTPIPLFEYADEPELQLPRYRVRFPGKAFSEPKLLFNYNDLHWPVSAVMMPLVHTVSVCPISDVGEFDCRSTGMIGGSYQEFYVSEESAYIWTYADEDYYEYRYLSDVPFEECTESQKKNNEHYVEAELYRLDLNTNDLTVARVAGLPLDQFSLDEREDRFLALVEWVPTNCDFIEIENTTLRFINLPKSEFRRTANKFNIEHATHLNAPVGSGVENRFAKNHLVYATRNSSWKSPPLNVVAVQPQNGSAYIMPLDQPGNVSTVLLAHDAQRLELFGEGVIVDGYADDTGLKLSTIDLRAPGAVAATISLPDYYESEGRSHGINMIVNEDGSGTFGLPVAQSETSAKYNYRSLEDYADVAFVSMDENLSMQLAGMLLANPDSENEDYECEVSCYGYYGNARPLFVRGRVFALTGSELIEGDYIGSVLYEVGRVSLQGEPANK